MIYFVYIYNVVFYYRHSVCLFAYNLRALLYKRYNIKKKNRSKLFSFNNWKNIRHGSESAVGKYDIVVTYILY